MYYLPSQLGQIATDATCWHVSDFDTLISTLGLEAWENAVEEVVEVKGMLLPMLVSTSASARGQPSRWTRSRGSLPCLFSIFSVNLDISWHFQYSCLSCSNGFEF